MAELSPFPERKTGEPIEWYRRFCAWLVQKPPRSLLAVYKLEREEPGMKKHDAVPGSWAGKPDAWEWSTRAAEWDKAEQNRLALDLAEARDQQRKHELDAAAKLRKKGDDLIALSHVRQRSKQPATGKARSKEIIIEATPPAVFRTAALLYRESRVSARSALEMADIRTSDESINIDLSLLSDEQIDRLARGEKLIQILAYPGSGGAGTAPPQAPGS
jgi:hypothetical protein